MAAGAELGNQTSATALQMANAILNGGILAQGHKPGGRVRGQVDGPHLPDFDMITRHAFAAHASFGKGHPAWP